MQRISDMLGKVIDSYHIQEVLGKGGMGIVFKAVDTSLDKVVALKVMNPLLVEDERFLRRFKSEAKALGRLHHPHIVSVFALRHIEEHFFIVMEYVEGANLAEHIKRHGPMAWQEALPIMVQTLNAIDYAHRQKIIHRDIKPHNILISREGHAKVTDFGLAKIQTAHSETRALTRTGFTGGTLYYMPPEQLEGLAAVDHRGDIYGLGMTFYEMLAGRIPFDKMSSEFTILKAIDAHDFPSLDQFNKDLPEPLVRIVMKAIERYPDDRYQSAGDMVRELEAWQAGTPAAPIEDRAATPSPSTPETPATPRPARSKTIPPPRLPEALPAAPPPAKSTQDRSNVLASLKVALAKGIQRLSSARRTQRGASGKEADALAKTVIKKASFKASSKPPSKAPPKAPPRQPVATPSQQPKPSPDGKKDRDTAPPKSAPATLQPQPARKPTPRAIQIARQRPVLVIGAVGVVLLLAFLLYVGTQGPSLSPSVAADSTAIEETVLLTLRTLPDEALVYIDGQQVGSSPLIDYEISAGSTAFHIEKLGYIALDTSITLGLNLDSTFTFSLLEEVEEVEVVAQRPVDQPPPVGTLTIRSEPPGADVVLDGLSLGQTPLTLEDPEAGAHDLILRKQGFVDHLESITVASGVENQVTATLVALIGTLKITIRPFGDLYIDGIVKGQGSVESYTEAFSLGVYQVHVTHPEFGVWDKQITINSSGIQDILFNFNQTFEVAVTSEPDEAEILVDGQPVDERTPAVILVRAGQRTIAVRRKGYLMEGAARRITLERNRTDAPLHFPLRAIQ